MRRRPAHRVRRPPLGSPPDADAQATIETKVGRTMPRHGGSWHFHVTFPGMKGPVARSCPFWHVPPAYLGAASVYGNATWCVVREPAARVLSAFKESRGQSQSLGDADAASAYVLKTLTVGVFPVGRQCHLVPQRLFVFGPEGARTCQHVLRFENLAGDFDALMARFGVPWTWKADFPEARARTHHGASNLTAESLSPAARRRVEDVYRRDYCALGYAAPHVSCSAADGPTLGEVLGGA